MTTMTEEQLYNVPLPEATASYSPVSHKHIIEGIKETVDQSNLQIVGTQYQTNHNGEALVGYFDLGNDSDIFNYRFAFRNSYDKSMSVAFVAGTSVMICSNGMIVGETQFIRKHTGSVAAELAEKIKRVSGELDNVLHTAERHAIQMQNINLNPTQVAELCGRWFMEQEIIRSSQLNIIKAQLKNPDHPEFAESNLWSLYNHATHALKKTAPYDYLNKYKDLHNFVEAEYQLV